MTGPAQGPEPTEGRACAEPTSRNSEFDVRCSKFSPLSGAHSLCVDEALPACGPRRGWSRRREGLVGELRKASWGAACNLAVRKHGTAARSFIDHLATSSSSTAPEFSQQSHHSPISR